MICLDIWENDIVQLIERMKGGDLEPSDSLLANGAMLLLMRSPLWDTQFSNAKLIAHNNESGYCYIDLPGLEDPDNEAIDIRDDETINLLSWRYHDCDYGDLIPWDFDPKASESEIKDPYSIPLMRELVLGLSQNPYYAKFLTQDPVEIARLLQEKNDITYSIMEGVDIADISKLSGMASYHTNIPADVYGHRYSRNSQLSTYIVASSLIGPVGLLGMWKPESSYIAGTDLEGYVISFVSVSPGFRKRGIATQLMRSAFDFCSQNSLVVVRTSPSKLGELSCESFTRLANEEYPDTPVILHNEQFVLTRIARSLDNSNATKMDKLKEIAHILRSCRIHPPTRFNDLSDEYLSKLEEILSSKQKDIESIYEPS